MRMYITEFQALTYFIEQWSLQVSVLHSRCLGPNVVVEMTVLVSPSHKQSMAMVTYQTQSGRRSHVPTSYMVNDDGAVVLRVSRIGAFQVYVL